ncbi:MAG: hypothetical protein QXD66_00175 [Candidatus Nezhaarchaeales archaeon]|nr:MAG: haloacid dehalogenase [Candidatus Nezhaarchaeota archaeon WYZ-LMO7]
MLDELNEVRSSINELSKKLLSKVEAREELSLKARKAIRLCGEAISLSHRDRVLEAKERLREAKEVIEELRPKQQDLDLEVFNVLLQEYVEAEALVRIVEGKDIPSADELQVTGEAYVLGLADLIGELRRRVLEEIRKGDALKAEHLYTLMRELYELLWPLEYPRSLVPGLRHKIDVIRRIVDDTLHDLTLMKMLGFR